MTASKFLDSSAWLSYFYAEGKEIKEYIESEDLLFTSVISLLEIKNNPRSRSAKMRAAVIQ